VKYHAGINDVKYVYGVADPVARLKPGEILDTNTLDCFGNALKKPGDTLSMAKGDNPLTGPFYVEGAQPGDTLAVKILDLQVDGDNGVGARAPGFGALNATNYTPMLHPPCPKRSGFTPSTMWTILRHLRRWIRIFRSRFPCILSSGASV
jgi:acetamidase/formamidase